MLAKACAGDPQLPPISESARKFGVQTTFDRETRATPHVAGLNLSDRRGHVFVCSLHGEALRVVEELDRTGVASVVIDDDPDTRLVRILGRLGVPLIVADAREMRPDATVVVQLSNAAVGRALSDVGIRVLDVAELTAPSIVDACLLTGRRDMQLGEPFTILEVDCLRAGTLREVYADLVPTAIVSSGTGEVLIARTRCADRAGRCHRAARYH